jgi:hypothetical protein
MHARRGDEGLTTRIDAMLETMAHIDVYAGHATAAKTALVHRSAEQGARALAYLLPTQALDSCSTAS